MPDKIHPLHRFYFSLLFLADYNAVIYEPWSAFQLKLYIVQHWISPVAEEPE